MCVAVSARSAFVGGQGLCCDQWVFSVQGAAQGQNAVLPETRGDRKPGPEGARRRRIQVSCSDVTLPS